MITYRFARNVMGAYLRVARGLRIEGAELVPGDGPVIICPNHVKWLDPFVVACGTTRPIFFMAKQELFRSRLQQAVFESLGAFAVRRGEPDRAMLRRCVGLLKDGSAVGIFPEGTRSVTGQLGPGEPGAAVISLLTGARIVPAGIVGYHPGQSVVLRWGEPIDPEAFGGPAARRDRLAIRQLTDAVMAAIARLTDQQPPPAEDSAATASAGCEDSHD